MLARAAILCAIGVCISGAYSQETRSNLPTVPQGFNASARIEINAPTEKVWSALSDLPSYPKWNPFVRSMTIIDDEGTPLPAEVQILRERQTMRLHVEIPPLSRPVNAYTPDSWTGQVATVNITDVQPSQGRFAYEVIDAPAFLLSSKRWSTVLDLGGNKTLYESREVFYGAAAPVVKFLLETQMEKGFSAQARALKSYCERLV